MDDLKQIGIDKIGHQKKIIKYAERIQTSENTIVTGSKMQCELI